MWALGQPGDGTSVLTALSTRTGERLRERVLPTTDVIDVSGDRNFVWVALAVNERLSGPRHELLRLDSETLQDRGSVMLPSTPERIAIIGKNVWVGTYQGGVLVVDRISLKLRNSVVLPGTVSFIRDFGSSVWVLGSTSHDSAAVVSIYQLDADTRKIVRQRTLSGGLPGGLVVDSTGVWAALTNTDLSRGRLLHLDRWSRVVMSREVPDLTTIAGASGELWALTIPARGDGNVWRVNTRDGNSLASFTIADSSGTMVLSADDVFLGTGQGVERQPRKLD